MKTAFLGCLLVASACGPATPDARGPVVPETSNEVLVLAVAPPPGGTRVVAGESPTQLRENEAEAAIVEYYNRRGEWAGIFTFVSIQQMRMEPVAGRRDLEIDVHVQYTYEPVPGNRDGRTDSGQDQRIFTFVKHRGAWRVTQMSGHMTALF